MIGEIILGILSIIFAGLYGYYRQKCTYYENLLKLNKIVYKEFEEYRDECEDVK